MPPRDRIVQLLGIYLLVFTCGRAEEQPKSRDVECPRPVPIDNGGFRLTNSGVRVEYECRGHFIAVGHTASVCSGGTWTRPPPVCVAPGCEPMQAMKHGYIILSYGGAVARFRCEEGFRLKGPVVIVCNGHEWNGTVPDCIGKYDHKSSLYSVKVGGKNNEAYTKPKKYLHSGSDRHKTHEQWLGEADYTCVGHDRSVPPPRVPNAVPYTKWVIMDEQPRLYAVYRCKWHFVPVSDRNNLYCQNAEWKGTRPKCIRKVEPLIATGVQGDDPEPGSSSHEDWLRYADYTCFSPDKKPTAPPVPHAQTRYRYSVIDGVPHLYVEYRCEDGYVLGGGSGYMYCHDHTWHGDLPTCAKSENVNVCAVGNGGCEQKCIVTREGSDVECGCKPGYRLNDDARTCRDIDECWINNGGCDHECKNIDGSYKCTCNDNFILDQDGHTCIAIRHRGESSEKVPPLVLFHHED